MLSFGPTPEEISARLVSHMEATRKRDKVFTIVLLLLAGAFLACFFGYRHEAEFGIVYYSPPFNWYLGLPAAAAPWLFTVRLYRHLRARRSRRFFIG